MERLLLFTVLKPQGIKGDLKIKYYADNFDVLKGIKKVYLDNEKEYVIKKIRDDSNDFAIIYLEGCDTRNDAELLRNKSFYADKKDIKKRKDSFFISDLIGLDIYFKGEKIGVVTNVTNGNVDMFEYKSIDGRIGHFPFLKVLEIDIDLDKNSLTISSDKFLEVLYLEDWHFNPIPRYVCPS